MNKATVKKATSTKALKSDIILASETVAPPPIALPTRKIAILGTTPSRMQAPIDDPTWEIWTIGPGGKDAHRWDRLYEIHTVWPLDFGERPKPEDKSYLDDLSQVAPPQQIVSVVPLKTRMALWAESHGKDEAWLRETIRGDFAANVVIDRDALFEKYGRMLFSSSIGYALVDAIEAGASDIGCWGIDLESGEEYISQHVGCRHFLDLARLAGINLHFPDGGCGLTRDLNPYPDRYETHLALTFEKKRKWIDHMVAEREAQFEGMRLEQFRLEGRLLLFREQGAPPEVIAENEQRLIQINRDVGNLAAGVNQLKGERSATEFYQRMYVWGMMEPGG